MESTAAVAYTGTLAALCIATGVLYSRVYASDPGWVTDDVAPHESGSQKTAPPCQYCGVRPPLRSRHCLNTGQCVRKFDHYCHLLSTAVGDLNHADFFLFILCELTLSSETLAVFTVGRWAGRCLGSAEHPAAWQACWNNPQPVLLLPLGVALSLVATAFAYLVALHLYLMLTGQTTYEVVKGPRVPYLAPFFPVNEHCANYYALPAAFFPRLLADTCLRRRTAPPAPFSRPSVVANLRLFWFARKPHVYRYTKTVDVDEGGDAEQPRLGPAEMAFAQAVDLQLSQRDV